MRCARAQRRIHCLASRRRVRRQPASAARWLACSAHAPALRGVCMRASRADATCAVHTAETSLLPLPSYAACSHRPAPHPLAPDLRRGQFLSTTEDVAAAAPSSPRPCPSYILHPASCSPCLALPCAAASGCQLPPPPRPTRQHQCHPRLPRSQPQPVRPKPVRQPDSPSNIAAPSSKSHHLTSHPDPGHSRSAASWPVLQMPGSMIRDSRCMIHGACFGRSGRPS